MSAPSLSQADLPDLGLARLRQAQGFLQDKVWRTPLVTMPDLRTPCGRAIVVKAESLQISGSFKIRGATNFIGRLDRDRHAKGVIAYSTGNHGRAVAAAARAFGVPATVVMSTDAAPHKISAIEALGAAVVMAPPVSLERRALAERIALEQALALLPPFDDEEVLRGQATVALEILDRCAPLAIFVPVGGGGLLAATAAAAKQIDPRIKVVGVEPDGEDDTTRSFRSGTRVVLSEASASIADAVRLLTPGKLTLPVIERYVDDMVTVSETEIAEATVEAASLAHLVLEPSGALAIAAAKTYRGLSAAEGIVVAIGTGGNTTLETLASLYHGLPARGRSINSCEKGVS